MPKFLTVFLAALLMTSCHCGGIQKTPKAPNAVVSHLMSSTVALVYTHIDMPEVDPNKEVDPDEEPVRPTLEVRTYCTAVWVSKDVMLTARHCVRGVAEVEQVGDPENVVIHYSTNSENAVPHQDPLGVHLGKVLKIDPDNDIALIRASGEDTIPQHEIAEVADQMPGIGSDLWIVGHPKGMVFSVVKGSVAAYRTFTDTVLTGEGHWVQVQAPVFYGNSGGGAFDEDGRLIGICSLLALYKAGFSPGIVPSMGFFVDGNVIHQLIDSVKK